MPIFTAIAAGIAAAVGITSTFAVGAIAFGLEAVASIGLSYAAQKLAGNKSSPSAAATDSFAVQGALNTGGDVPRSFNVGYSVTGGSLVYANTAGYIGGPTSSDPNGTPNAFLFQVIALSDLPGCQLQEFWCNGQKCTLVGNNSDSSGKSVVEFTKSGTPYLWVKYYDGTQTTADPTLAAIFGGDAHRPYATTRVGKGVCYAIVTSCVENTLFNGFPSFKFGLSGIPLYDPSKDSTNGGTGTHRYSDPTTWGGDGDNLPAVQIYNVLRGIKYNGSWVYGLQDMTAARLPTINWNAQIGKCRTPITGVSGLEPTYRSGGQINIDTQPANAIQSLLTACQGKLSETGGFYKIHLGAPDSPSFSFTDDDIISTEQQDFTPFFGLADSVNGITGRYPSPSQGWNTIAAPSLYRSDLETRDGNRRLLADVAFDFVPYDAQVQRLMKSAVDEAQRARRHTLVLPPEFWVVEPGDVGEWSSTRNGYDAKQFRVDGCIDKANLDVGFSITEVDPSDYDWNHSTDFTNVNGGTTIIIRPSPQGVIDWFAEPSTINDASGVPRRPAIRLSWDGTQLGVDGVQYEVRLTSSSEVVARGRTDQLAAGALLISQSLLPNTAYQARGQYLPSAPRDMLWSDWLDVTTPDIRFTLADFADELSAQIANIESVDQDAINQALTLIASTAANQDARNWFDKKEVRGQLDAVAGSANASIATIQQAMANDETAFANFQTQVNATFGPSFSSVSTVSSAVATLNGYAAAQWSVTVDVNGNVAGINLINGGSGTSAFIVNVDKFQITKPGVSGGTAVPIFTVGNVSGAPKIAIRADMFLDGTITGTMIQAGTVQAIHIAAGSIDATKIAANSITTNQIAVGGVDLPNIIAGAVSNTQVFSTAQNTNMSAATQLTLLNQTVNIQSGKATMMLCAAWCGGVFQAAAGAVDAFIDFYVDGTLVKSFDWAYIYNVAGDNNYRLVNPFTVHWTVTGLSAGNHTFMMVEHANGPHGIFAGQAYITDFRR